MGAETGRVEVALAGGRLLRLGADEIDVDDDGRLWLRDHGLAVAVFSEWSHVHYVGAL